MIQYQENIVFPLSIYTPLHPINCIPSMEGHALLQFLVFLKGIVWYATSSLQEPHSMLLTL